MGGEGGVCGPLEALDVLGETCRDSLEVLRKEHWSRATSMVGLSGKVIQSERVAWLLELNFI